MNWAYVYMMSVLVVAYCLIIIIIIIYLPICGVSSSDGSNRKTKFFKDDYMRSHWLRK